jgi:dTMP kinase
MVELTKTQAEALRGKFIVLDGPDGAGKSTQRQRLADELASHGVPVVLCRDPGGTQIGDRIRSVLLDYDLSKMHVACETLLFMASRAQLVGEIIHPALQRGHTVLCDRFVTATCAYQGAAGYDPARVIELARFAIGDTWPNLTVVIDVDPGEGFGRIGRRSTQAGKRRKTADEGEALPFIEGNVKDRPDAMEARSIEFHRKVRQMFREIPSYYPTRVLVVDGAGDADVVYRRVRQAVVRSLG